MIAAFRVILGIGQSLCNSLIIDRNDRLVCGIVNKTVNKNVHPLIPRPHTRVSSVEPDVVYSQLRDNHGYHQITD